MSDHSHFHPPPTGKGARVRLSLSILLTLAFVFFEAASGWMANSLALLTDAAHNLTDVLALILTWYALRIEEQPAHARMTFGYHRGGILIALVNSTTLVLISIGIFYEAYQRFQAPPTVATDILIGVGLAALAVNLVTAWLVSHGSHDDLNLRSAFLHLLGDVISTAGAIVAGIGIRYTGYQWLDPLASMLIGFLILWNAWIILRETIDILMESTPPDIEMSTMVRDLMQLDGVRGVHDLHVWSISKRLRLLSAHVVLDDMRISEAAEIQGRIEALIKHNYGIGHSTLQLETEVCMPGSLFCNFSTRDDHAHEHGHRGHH